MARIPQTPNTIGTDMRANLVDHIYAAQALANRAVAMMDVQRGAPPNYSLVEGTTLPGAGDFGIIASGTPGENGEAMWNLLVSIKNALNDASLQTFIARIDQG